MRAHELVRGSLGAYAKTFAEEFWYTLGGPGVLLSMPTVNLPRFLSIPATLLFLTAAALRRKPRTIP
jgi:hypothetical protein